MRVRLTIGLTVVFLGVHWGANVWAWTHPVAPEPEPPAYTPAGVGRTWFE